MFSVQHPGTWKLNNFVNNEKNMVNLDTFVEFHYFGSVVLILGILCVCKTACNDEHICSLTIHKKYALLCKISTKDLPKVS